MASDPFRSTLKWFNAWCELVVQVAPRADYPAISESGTGADGATVKRFAPFWLTFLRFFAKEETGQELATAAAWALGDDPPAHLGQLLATVRAKVADLKSRPEHAGVRADTRQAAEALSRGCRDCQGNGITLRCRHESRSRRRGDLVPLYCLCPLGRWFEKAHRDGNEVARSVHGVGIRDLAAYPWLQLRPVAWSDEPDNRYLYRPEQWDATAGRPILAAPAIDPKHASLNRMLKRSEEAKQQRHAAEMPAF